MTDRELFIALLDNQPVRSASAIVMLEGDGFSRIAESVRLYKQKVAPRIIVSGGLDKVNLGCFPAAILARELIKKGVPRKDIVLEEKSQHTQAQAEEVLALCKKNKWNSIILVASHYHHYRAFLTFLQQIQKMEYTGFGLQSVPVRDLSWQEKTPSGSRIELLGDEFKKITIYQKKKHVASFRAGIEYLCLPTKQPKK